MMYCIYDMSHGESKKIGWKPSSQYPDLAVWINECPICGKRWPEGYLISLEAALEGKYGPKLKED